jgi:hypothetical protein
MRLITAVAFVGIVFATGNVAGGEPDKGFKRGNLELMKPGFDTEEEKQAEAKPAPPPEPEPPTEEELVAHLKKNPKAMGLVFGAIFCRLKNARTAALAEIAKQKKYSRYGGVQNNVVLLQLQNAIRWADEKEAEERKTLRQEYKRVTPLACSNSMVKAVLICHADENTEGCDETLKRFASFIPDPGDDNDSDE